MVDLIDHNCSLKTQKSDDQRFSVLELTGSTVRIGVPGLFMDNEGVLWCQLANHIGHFTADTDGQSQQDNPERR